MSTCYRCGMTAIDSARYCPGCGSEVALATRSTRTPYNQISHPTMPESHHLAAARGFGQVFGIHPTIAFLTLVIDVMLFGGEAVTGFMTLPLSIGAGAVLGFIAYKAQINWYGDDKESAMIKGLILALLTAIPTPLPAILYVPSGIVGLVHNLRKKK